MENKRVKIINKILKKNQKDTVRVKFHTALENVINGRQMQVIVDGHQAYSIAFFVEYRVDVPTENDSTNALKQIYENCIIDSELQKTRYDLDDIKQSLKDFKEENRLLSKYAKKSFGEIQIGTAWFNPEYFINCVEALGKGVEFYLNPKPTGASLFKSDHGLAVIMPIRKL